MSSFSGNQTAFSSTHLHIHASTASVWIRIYRISEFSEWGFGVASSSHPAKSSI